MEQLIGLINEQFEEWIEQNTTLVKADKVRLDARCGSIWIGTDCVISLNGRNLDYYGGFEYIDDKHRKTFGEYVIYFAEDESDRVQDVIDAFAELKEE